MLSLCTVTKPDASNSNLVLLEFRTVPREIPNLKVENKTVITIICRGPYILYPYIEDPDEDMNPIASAFNITVISEQKKVLALIPFNTTDKTTWQSRILNLDENERISVYVDCIEPSCQYVGALCLGLHFMLGSVCLSDLPNIATWREEGWNLVHWQIRRQCHEYFGHQWTPEWYFLITASADSHWCFFQWYQNTCQSKQEHNANVTTENICQSCYSSGILFVAMVKIWATILLTSCITFKWPLKSVLTPYMEVTSSFSCCMDVLKNKRLI